MRIQHTTEGNTFTVSDDGFDSPHPWVSISVENSEGASTSMDILLDDIFPMLVAFDAKWARLQAKEE